MFGKPVALMQIPNQALFRPGHAAQYLGMSRDTLIKLTDLGVIPAKWDPHLKQRSYRLEDLNRYRDELPDYPPDRSHPNPGASRKGNHHGTL